MHAHVSGCPRGGSTSGDAKASIPASAARETDKSARRTGSDDGTQTGAFSEDSFATEVTAIGPQSLVPGVAAITPRDRLVWRAAAPLEPKKAQRGCDHGLFDLAARNQFDLFQPKGL